jgi:AAA domain (dynein-related subfamily)
MQSIVFKFIQLQQYDAITQTVLWEDNTPGRWSTIYSKLNIGDRSYFIGKGKVYCGILTNLEGNNKFQFSEIEIFNLLADDFLSLNASHPEINARVKAQFQPFISPQEINFDLFRQEAMARKFVRFFIVKKEYFNPDKYIENDRIALLNEDMVFEEFGILSNKILINVSEDLFNVKGKSLYDVKQIFQTINEKNKKERSNNVNLINRIESALQRNSVYEFESFSSYFNIIHNKKAYLYSNVDTIQYYVGGAYWNSANPTDQTKRFLEEGVWENGYADKFTDLVNEIPAGSMIAVKSTYKQSDEMEIKAIGAVKSNYQDGQTLEVEWDENFRPFFVDYSGGYWDTIKRVTKPEHIKDIFFHEPDIDLLTTKSTANMSENDSRNKILYGPPGTGKTYSTIEKSIKLVSKDFVWPKDGTEEEKRKKIKEHYEQLCLEGKIRFITFHQSLSYEDFIEGIKPNLEKESSERLSYQIQPGLFKQIAVDAAFSYVSRDDENVKTALDFSDLYDVLIEDISEKLAKSEKVLLQTKSEGQIEVIHVSDNDNLLLRHLDTEGRKYTVSKNRLEVLFSAIPDLYAVNNIHQVFKGIIGGMNSTAYWSVFNKILEIKNDTSIAKPKKDLQSYTYEEKENAISKINWKTAITNEVENFVLIIDEINRGNVSQIFGELITLIEDDKRTGKDEALSVTLPYSKKLFSVPPNLYIIGTMNTADRSIEALDTALRRRFSFEFKPPDPSLLNATITGLELKTLLATINERISYLLDHDHQVGHSYFMKITDEKGLREVFNNKIIPLLKEYFYNDFGKIRLILGNGFVEKKTNYLPKFAVADVNELNRDVFILNDIGGDFDIIKALKQTIAGE